jgi:hypothetical protein
VVSLPEPEAEAPTGEEGGRGGVLGDPDRVMQRQDEHIRSDRHVLGPGTDGRRDHER